MVIMKINLTHKILQSHLVEGELVAGNEIGIRIDHTLLQDATGTLAMLEFEALGLDRVKVELAAQYVDHNLLQTDNKNADDHRFLQTAAARFGVHFSKPGNGVSHQVHMERFGVPGKTLLGVGQPHAGRGRRVHARHRRRRSGRGAGHGRLSLSSPVSQGARRQAYWASCPTG